MIRKNPSQPDNDHTSRIKGGDRQAGETGTDQKGSLRTNTNPCICSWWSRELHIGGGLEMTVLKKMAHSEDVQSLDWPGKGQLRLLSRMERLMFAFKVCVAFLGKLS